MTLTLNKCCKNKTLFAHWNNKVDRILGPLDGADARYYENTRQQRSGGGMTHTKYKNANANAFLLLACH